MTGIVVNESLLTSSTASIVAYNRGNIGATSDYVGAYYLGGIVGSDDGGTISYSYASCTIETVSSTGGIRTNPSSTPSNCYYDVTEDDYGTTSTAV